VALRERILGLPGGQWYANRSKPDIDWTNRTAKDEAVSILVEDELSRPTIAKLLKQLRDNRLITWNGQSPNDPHATWSTHLR